MIISALVAVPFSLTNRIFVNSIMETTNGYNVGNVELNIIVYYILAMLLYSFFIKKLFIWLKIQNLLNRYSECLKKCYFIDSLGLFTSENIVLMSYIWIFIASYIFNFSFIPSKIDFNIQTISLYFMINTIISNRSIKNQAKK